MSEKVKPIAFAPATAEDLALEEAAKQVLDESLATTRAAAADWAKTIAALTGVFGIVGLIKGREDVTTLVLPARVLIGLFVAVGLIFAIRAILLAALAAEGTPTTWWVVGNRLKDRYRGERELAAQQLRHSREGAIAAAGCLIVAVGIAWYSPEEKVAPDPVQVLVTFADRPPICADLAAVGDALQVGEVSVNDGNVRSLNVVSHCPQP